MKSRKNYFSVFLLLIAPMLSPGAMAIVNPTVDAFSNVTINTAITKNAGYSFTIKPSTAINADTTINIQPNQAHVVQFDNTGAATLANGEELMIRTLDVVSDVRTQGPSGAWSFGHLVQEMVPPGVSVEAFLRNWLAAWSQNQNINGLTVAARPNIQTILNNWPKNTDGTLSLSQAPFRLLAIVNRLDLNSVDAQGNVTSAGEGRFVFGVINPNAAPNDTLQFTVIFEYRLPATNTMQLNEWVREWHDLGLTTGAEYLQRLQTLTDRFSSRNADPFNPIAVGGNAIHQIRTNEIALAGPWELREFNLMSSGLQEVTVNKTPDLDTTIANRPRFNRFLQQNSAAILNNTYTIPAAFENTPFLAGSALNRVVPVFSPRSPILGDQNSLANERHIVELNGCMGCHGSETAILFLQINPRLANEASTLSTFLTGAANVTDPVNPNIVRNFNDLSTRKCIMTNLVNGTATACSSETLVSGGSAAQAKSFSAMSVANSPTTSANGENVTRRTRSD